MKTLLFLIAAISVTPTLYSKEQQSRTQLCRKLDLAIKPYAQYGVFQGNVLLAKNGKRICQTNVGFTDELQKTAISNSTRFPIASLSKPIMAALLLRLDEEGRLDLDRSLDTYLPEFQAKWAAQVTLDHLLANRSGLPGHFRLPGWQSGRYRTTLPKQVILNDIAQLDLEFGPGTNYRYSNLGWLLLAEVVESVTNKSLDENLHKYVFAPLFMANTGLVYNTDSQLVKGLRWAKGGEWKPQPDIHMQIFNGGSGIYSVSEDLLAFINALHNDNWLSLESKNRMFSADALYAWRVENISLSDQVELTIHNYDGQLEGHSSLIYHIPQDELSLVLLSNTGMGIEHKRSVAEDILKALYRVNIPDRSKAPSLLLSNSLITNTWLSTINELSKKAVKDHEEALLLVDLAQQLDWSGNESKAIDLYLWLVTSFPKYQPLRSQLERLCRSNSENIGCRTTPL